MRQRRIKLIGIVLGNMEQQPNLNFDVNEYSLLLKQTSNKLGPDPSGTVVAPALADFRRISRVVRRVIQKRCLRLYRCSIGSSISIMGA